MNKKKVICPVLLIGIPLLVFVLWPDSNETASGGMDSSRQGQISPQTQILQNLKPGPRDRKTKKSEPQLLQQSTDEDLERLKFEEELQSLEVQMAEEVVNCEKTIDGRLNDLNFIDPNSSFYEDVERVEDLLNTSILNMNPHVISEMTWLIQDYIRDHDPLDIEKLVSLHNEVQEYCLTSSAVTFIHTAIESCRDRCPPRLKNTLGGIIFDGLPLVSYGVTGAERTLFILSVMETSNRFGPYYISMNGELEDLRFRVQRNYELYQEELQQNKGRPARMAQAFRSYIEESDFLREEVIKLLKNAGMRYSE